MGSAPECARCRISACPDCASVRPPIAIYRLRNVSAIARQIGVAANRAASSGSARPPRRSACATGRGPPRLPAPSAWCRSVSRLATRRLDAMNSPFLIQQQNRIPGSRSKSVPDFIQVNQPSRGAASSSRPQLAAAALPRASRMSCTSNSISPPEKNASVARSGSQASPSAESQVLLLGERPQLDARPRLLVPDLVAGHGCPSRVDRNRSRLLKRHWLSGSADASAHELLDLHRHVEVILQTAPAPSPNASAARAARYKTGAARRGTGLRS